MADGKDSVTKGVEMWNATVNNLGSQVQQQTNITFTTFLHLKSGSVKLMVGVLSIRLFLLTHIKSAYINMTNEGTAGVWKSPKPCRVKERMRTIISFSSLAFLKRRYLLLKRIYLRIDFTRSSVKRSTLLSTRNWPQLRNAHRTS